MSQKTDHHSNKNPDGASIAAQQQEAAVRMRICKEKSAKILCIRALTTRFVGYFALLFKTGCCLMQISLLEVIQDVHFQPKEHPTVRKATW